VEYQAHGVLADRFDGADVHRFLADLQHRLTRAVAADFGRRRVYAQVFARQPEAPAVVERHFQHAGALVELDQSRHHAVLFALKSLHQRMYRLKSSLRARSARCFSTYSASMRMVCPLRSGASNDTVSSKRSMTVCRRRAPMFSVRSLTSQATSAILATPSSVNSRRQPSVSISAWY